MGDKTVARKYGQLPRIFYVYRQTDISGVSGTGLVAEGVRFTNGKVSITWRTEIASVTIYDSMLDALRIHGHGGFTKFIWANDVSWVHLDDKLLAYFDSKQDPVPSQNHWIRELDLYEPGPFPPSTDQI